MAYAGLACLVGGTRIGRARGGRRTWLALCVAVAMAITGSTSVAHAQPSRWGWGSASQAATAWTPENLADYLLTGQTPHPAVARIIAPEQGSTSLGSGVLVDMNRNQGLVLTNWHVVRESRSAVLVQFPDGFQSAGTVVRWDEAWDLAALVIWKPTATPVPIAGAPPAVGEPLTIAGFGRGPYREQTGPCTEYLSPGSGYPHELVELRARARQGDSGGPIFNARGELAGVLFGESDGRTIGSCSTRVRGFLETVGSRGFVPTPIGEFSDARAIDRGIGSAVQPQALAEGGNLPVQRSTQVDTSPSLPPAGPVGMPSAMPPQDARVGPRHDGTAVGHGPTPGSATGLDQPKASPQPPDFLAAAGGLALVGLGLRILMGGRRRHDPVT